MAYMEKEAEYLWSKLYSIKGESMNKEEQKEVIRLHMAHVASEKFKSGVDSAVKKNAIKTNAY